MPMDPSQLQDWAVNRGIAIVTNNYDERELIFPRFCRMMSMDELTDKPWGARFGTLTGVGKPKRLVNGQAPDSDSLLDGYSWQIAANEYGIEVPIPYDMLESDNAQRRVESLVNQTATSFVQQVGIEKDQMVADFLQKGTIAAGDTDVFDSTYTGNRDGNRGKIYDGKAFFATDHPLLHVAGATRSNITESAAFSSDTLQAGRIAMSQTNAVDERGRPIAVRPTTIVTTAQGEKAAHVVVNSMLAPGSANNDTNFQQGKYEVIVNDYLTDDTDAWWLGQAGRGIVAVDSGAPEITPVRDDRRRTLFLNFKYRFGVAVEDWRFWHAFNKATS